MVALFREAGWRTVETDELVRDLLARDDAVHDALRMRWGDTVFSEDGLVDRKAIAAHVFADDSELKWLEQLLHPRVRALWEGMVVATPQANWLVEIPLLFEKRLESCFNFTVCVTSTPDVVEVRVVQRGYSGAEVRQRRKRQMLMDEKVRRAEYLLSNSGSLEFLKLQTTRLIDQLNRNA